jgi:hypothetical protein
LEAVIHTASPVRLSFHPSFVCSPLS